MSPIVLGPCGFVFIVAVFLSASESNQSRNLVWALCCVCSLCWIRVFLVYCCPSILHAVTRSVGGLGHALMDSGLFPELFICFFGRESMIGNEIRMCAGVEELRFSAWRELRPVGPQALWSARSMEPFSPTLNSPRIVRRYFQTSSILFYPSYNTSIIL